MTDDGGVLGNLPNSRPGKRSEKRDTAASRPAKSAARAASKAEAEGTAAAKSRTSAKPGRKAAGKASPGGAKARTTASKSGAPGDGFDFDPAMRGEGRIDPVPPPASEDPVGAVVRTGASIAGAGLKVAEAVTRELFRRLPRP